MQFSYTYDEPFGFHNHSKLDIRALKGDPDNVGRHLQDYGNFLPMEAVGEEGGLLEDERNQALKEALNASITLLKERRSALITAAVTGQINLDDMLLDLPGKEVCR